MGERKNPSMSALTIINDPATIGQNIENLPKYAQLILHTHILNPPFTFDVKETIVEEFFAYVNCYAPQTNQQLTIQQKMGYVPNSEYSENLKSITIEPTKPQLENINETHYQTYVENIENIFKTLFCSVMEQTGLTGEPVLPEQEIVKLGEETTALKPQMKKAVARTVTKQAVLHGTIPLGLVISSTAVIADSMYERFIMTGAGFALVPLGFTLALLGGLITFASWGISDDIAAAIAEKKNKIKLQKGDKKLISEYEVKKKRYEAVTKDKPVIDTLKLELTQLELI